MLSSFVSTLALASIALALPTKRADAVSGTIAVSSVNGSITTFVGALESEGRYTLSDSPITVTLPSCAPDYFSIETSSGLIGATSNGTVRAGPSVSQALAVRVALREVRLAQYNLSGSIAFEAVQKIRAIAAKTVASIRYDEYNDAEVELENMKRNWEQPYTAAQNETIANWFNNAQGAATEAFKADYSSCVAAKRAVVQANVTQTIAEAAIEGFFIPGDFASAAAAEADRVAKIAAAFNDTKCIAYTAIINNSLSPASTVILANNTAFDFDLAAALTLVSATELSLRSTELSEAQAQADVDTSAVAIFISSTSSSVETNLFSIDCESQLLAARFINTDGSISNGSFINLGTNFGFTGNVSAFNERNQKESVELMFTFEQSL